MTKFQLILQKHEIPINHHEIPININKLHKLHAIFGASSAFWGPVAEVFSCKASAKACRASRSITMGRFLATEMMKWFLLLMVVNGD